ncbi:class I SAM-dependent methyltransferase [Chitinophaga sp. Cy-1792]|uniref:class I SAM-dependent methyltransferase n=1 Tax=Chitinophaga sp. Cy-1792 TaxID=2608339 RepID=UPI001421DC60|nr:class I SAM-dependent methyltransferase [Chitinophaga sp. Cy-1792]NIG53895.1 class I SAM-dependent methyltransferase [Chitinophaga sp. Cy-1792]
MKDHLKVPATSTLVLKYSGEIYHSEKEQAYLQNLTYSEITELAAEINKTCPPLGEMIVLRKYAVRRFLEYWLSNGKFQVCILAAGAEPLSAYLTTHLHKNIIHIFEIDRGHLDLKKELYQQLDIDSSNISFIQQDLRDTGTFWNNLVQHGYDPAQPTLITCEGLLPYIGNEDFVKILKLFMTHGKQNKVIFDSAIDINSVREFNQTYHQGILDIMCKFINGDINNNSRNTILELLQQLQPENIVVETMAEIELKIRGRQTTFHETGDGLEEMVSLDL